MVTTSFFSVERRMHPVRPQLRARALASRLTCTHVDSRATRSRRPPPPVQKAYVNAFITHFITYARAAQDAQDQGTSHGSNVWLLCLWPSPPVVPVRTRRECPRLVPSRGFDSPFGLQRKGFDFATNAAASALFTICLSCFAPRPLFCGFSAAHNHNHNPLSSD